MYSAQRLEVPSKTTMERMYSMSSPLNVEGNMSSPKKENMFQSVFNALNVIWESFSRVPSSFVTNINNPLSVTVVQNEGIISHEFFKTLTTRKELLTTDNVYIREPEKKESLNIIESIQCSMFDEKQSYVTNPFNQNTKSNCKYVNVKSNGFADGSQNISGFMECNKAKSNSTVKSDCSPLLDNGKQKTKGEQCRCVCSDVANEICAMKDLRNCDKIKRDSSSNEQFFTSIDTSTESVNTAPPLPQTNQTAISNLLSNMWQRVVGGVTDQLNLRTESTETDATMKRSYSPKQRRKLNTVAKGRGRGRARSQLRRSGVSQTRHRKERTKHDLEEDIQDDFESWQEFAMFHTVENQSIDCFNLDEDAVDFSNSAEFLIQDTVSPVTYTFADVTPRSRKSKARKVNEDTSKFPMRVRYLPECGLEINAFRLDCNEKTYDSQRNAFRPRLPSESSVDSEDSYCVVFETGSETNYKSDFDDNEESDDEQNTEDEQSESSKQKVKFNLKPIVHMMVQWDYAYRAARRGPWEEMARDRERFKGRINCIERVLNPILTAQHRTHVWQQRFAK